MVKKFIVVMLVIAAGLLLSGCCCCSIPATQSGVSPTGSTSGSGDIDTSHFNIDTSSSVSESNAAMQKIAGYLISDDIRSFNDSLSMNAHALTGGSLNIPADRAAKAGQAMKVAKMTSASVDVVFYETSIDGVSYTFNMAKEGGVWKLDQF
jgi:hypothetical protein